MKGKEGCIQPYQLLLIISYGLVFEGAGSYGGHSLQPLL